MPQEIIGRGWFFFTKTGPSIGPQGRLALTNEWNEISQSIEIILSTAPGERVMRPTFGCRLHELVFAPNTSHTIATARRFVEEALGMWEPRIRVKQVNIWPEEDEDGQSFLRVEIEYELKATRDRRSLVYPFYLIPEEAPVENPLLETVFSENYAHTEYERSVP
jgi:phage baseplate assembly protein W